MFGRCGDDDYSKSTRQSLCAVLLRFSGIIQRAVAVYSLNYSYIRTNTTTAITTTTATRTILCVYAVPAVVFPSVAANSSSSSSRSQHSRGTATDTGWKTGIGRSNTTLDNAVLPHQHHRLGTAADPSVDYHYPLSAPQQYEDERRSTLTTRLLTKRHSIW